MWTGLSDKGRAQTLNLYAFKVSCGYFAMDEEATLTYP
jgi:hypothetical protein